MFNCFPDADAWVGPGLATSLPMGNDSRSSSKRGVGVLLRVVIFLSKYAHLTPHTPATFCHALTYAIMSAFIC